MRLRNLTKLALGLACGSLILAACSSTSTNGGASSGIPTSGTKVSGGTATFAEPPSATPNYIFPFESAQYDTVNNVSQFQYLIYRPLYVFGAPNSNSVTLNDSLSLAQQPTYNGTSFSITMKGWKWSNGETVSATDVGFFMNMLHAEAASVWYAYVPGLFPDNVKSVTVNSPTQITFTTDKTYSSQWFTYNELGQITPFPLAWDVTAAGKAPGSGGCSSGTYGAASTDTACAAVYNYLTAQAKDVTTYANSPIWGVVDGPWKVSAFDSSGDVTMVPNDAYSGSPKPSLAAFKEVPFTTEAAEFNAVIGNQVDVGYLPREDVPSPTTNALVAGPNNGRVSGSYYMNPWVLFGYNYATYKLTSIGNNGTAGKVESQLYFRQAMQELIDQPLYDSKILKGYAVPTYGPVPVLPDNPYVDSFEKNNPLPYDPAKAKSLLSSHGWSVVPNGTDTCMKPGTASDECGAGIPAGTPLSFTFPYATGTPWQAEIMASEKASWASAGINVTLQPETFDTVVSAYAPACSSKSPCTQEMGWWGGGWVYAPDYLPTGELLFATGAANNSSNWADPMTDQLIAQTTTSNGGLSQYEDYIATHLPVMWQPNADYQLSEIKNSLRGVAPQCPNSNLFPEAWYFTK